MKQLVSLVTAAALALANPGIGLAADLHFPGTDAAAGTELPPLPQVAVGTVDLGALRDRAFDLALEFPAAQYDLDAVAESFAGDPSLAFAFVSQLLPDPYPGALRSPAAVLGARAGSSADKARLLVELLRRMGIEARYAFGTLDEDHRHQLRAFALMPHQRNLALDRVATLAGISAAGEERLAARARRDFAWLWAAVGGRLAPPAVAEIQPSPRHVWVQALIDGAWVDMDPEPYQEIGATMATLGTTADALPEQMAHMVRIAVVAEGLGDGGLAATTVLDRTLTAAEAADAQIFLSFGAEASGAGAIGSAITSAMGQGAVYKPALTIAGESVQGESLPPLSAVSADAGEGGGMFGEAAQDFFGEEAAAAAGPELAALYLDVTVQVPWAEPVTRRRVLIDRVDPAARSAGTVDRAALAQVLEAEGVPEPFRTVHQILVSNGGANPHYIAGDIGLAVEFVSEQMAAPEALAEMTLGEILWPVGALNAGVVLASEALSIEALNDSADVRFFAGSPRVFVMSFQPAAIAGQDGVRFAIDLLHDTVTAVGNPEVPGTLVAERVLWYGVLQSALETTLAELRSGGGGQVASTSIEMAAALAVLSGADQVGTAAPPALASALAAGELVVANAGTPADALSSWWTIDPADGSTRAIWAPGLGGGGGWRGPGNNYTNASSGGDRYIIDEAGNEIGRVRNGRDVYYRRPPGGGGGPPGGAGGAAGGRAAGSRCSGGSEYMVIVGCVSLPAGMALSTAYALVLGEIVLIAAGIIAANL